MFDFVNVGDRMRLELVLGPQETVDAVVWGMLSHNDISGVADVQRTGVDGTTRLAYDVTGHVPLRVIMDRTLRREQTFRLLSSLLDSLTEAGQYMIDAQWFVLDPDTVYVEPQTLAVRLVCVPVAGKGRGDVLTLLKHVVLNLRHDRSESTAYLGELVAMLNDPAGSDLARLTRSVRAGSLSSRLVVPAQPAPAEAPQYGVPAAVQQGSPAVDVVAVPRSRPGAGPGEASASSEKPMSLFYLLQHYTKANREIYDRQKRDRRAAADAVATASPGEAAPTVESVSYGIVPPRSAVAGPETVHGQAPGEPFGHTIHVSALQEARGAGPGLASGGAQPLQPGTSAAHGAPWAAPAPEVRAMLTVVSTGSRVMVEGALFRIGRRRARVDLAVAGETVSKVHATIHHVSPGQWSIIDNSSTNGVEVDGSRIEPLVPASLVAGQRIRIGDETLVFETFGG